jgi:uncharacterized protein
LKIQIAVKPNSKESKILEAEDGSLIVYLKAPPIDGKANQELITVLAKKYQVTKKQITIKSSLSRRKKLNEHSSALASPSKLSALRGKQGLGLLGGILRLYVFLYYF